MSSWNTFCERYFHFEPAALSLDLSRVRYPDSFVESMHPAMQQALEAMAQLEQGSIANPDENRMVGHYWLRDASLAPSAEIQQAITSALDQIQSVADQVHSGGIQGADGRFEHLLIIGIGGSALGPQFVDRALRNPKSDRLQTHFFDNTDPDGMDLVLAELEGQLGRTLSVVISKSGGTPETRNGMLEARHAYERAGLTFAQHAIAVTGEGSALDKVAESEGWITRFPMWDWVGGRTSELAAVGLLPAALQGLDYRGMLKGAAVMDRLTRSTNVNQNPAALLSLMWYYLTDGKGSKDMVVLPYKDRLELFSKYLQQLVMESLGKEYDLEGKVVNQGIAVYGNKGSTDQHAYVQQLREGLHNFFVTFIEVLEARKGDSMEVDPHTTAGDFLQGFYLGTRDALFEKGRESITITVRTVDGPTVGALIALFERAVGLYASLVNINAYHQPGVEAGKKAAAGILDLKNRIQALLQSRPGQELSVEAIAADLGSSAHCEQVFKLLAAKVVNDPAHFRGSGLNHPKSALFSYQD